VLKTFNQLAKLARARLVFGRELEEHFGVRDARLEALLPLDDALDAAALLQDLLRGLLIVPEVGLRRLRFELRKLFALRSYIKETSRAVRRACEALRHACANPCLHCPTAKLSTFILQTKTLKNYSTTETVFLLLAVSATAKSDIKAHAATNVSPKRV
jgi:hypothetical protein